MPSIQRDVLLQDYSTFGIGGPSDYFCDISSSEDLCQSLYFAKERDLPILIIGNGSNSLFADEGFRGLSLRMRLQEFIEEGKGRYRVGSGFSFARLGQIAAQRGFHGLEFAAGIPATVGGAVFMNAGASGSETQQTLMYVDVITYDGVSLRLLKEDLQFSYRSSLLQSTPYIVTSATFELTSSQTAKEVMQHCVDRRLKTQPYRDRSCGCIFKNPAATLPAGKLIDEQGLKGFSIGDALISSMHANFIVNRGKASAKDVQECILFVKKRVLEATGHLLKHEIKIFDQYGVLLHI